MLVVVRVPEKILEVSKSKVIEEPIFPLLAS
jgi:hypothetical protein